MKILKIGDYKIQRYITKDKIASKKWGKVWFKFNFNKGLMDGDSCVSCLHKYLPTKVMIEVEKAYPKDFAK